MCIYTYNIYMCEYNYVYICVSSLCVAEVDNRSLNQI